MKIKALILCLSLSVFSLGVSQETITPVQNHPQGLKINLIGKKNAVGIGRDFDILIQELTKLGHEVQFVDMDDCTPRAKVDINVHLGENEYFFPYADKNYLLPNPEWGSFPLEKVAKFDGVLCKTKEAERIFKPLNSNTQYMSFTCKDRFDETVQKDYKAPLHLVGASIQKGTDTLIQIWMNNPQFPLLLMIKHINQFNYPPTHNIKLISEYLQDSELMQAQNRSGLHLCPSITEGFGHYIVEAMSCGSVVVTTDAPPMNEFISDKRCLVGYNRTAPWSSATNYYVDPNKLETAILNLLILPEAELKEIGRKNREFYLENDRFFKQRLVEIFKREKIEDQKLTLSAMTEDIQKSSELPRNKNAQQLMSLIDAWIAMNKIEEALQLYRYFDCLLVDESVIHHSNKAIEKLRGQGKQVIATTDPRREAKENELVIVYGNYQHSHNNLPYANKIWRHPLYYQDVTHSKFEFDPAWESIGMIFIIGLEERKDRYQEILSELCRMRAPLNRIYHYIAKREAITGNKDIDIYAGATKNHGDVAEIFLKGPHHHCLILEDDVTFNADVEGNLQRLKLFFERAYDYDVCLLNSSKYHTIKEYDDLLLRSFQECTTTSAYLLSKSGAERALFYFRDGYEKILKSRNTNFCCDRYWAEMQKDNKFFLFKTKFGYQRCGYSSITGKTECHFD